MRFVPETIKLSVHEMPPGHGHRCAYVGGFDREKFHVRVSLDQIRGGSRPEPHLTLQIFPKFTDPFPERDASFKPFSQLLDTHHEVLIPLLNPRKPSVRDYNRATLGSTRKTHAVALEGAANLGESLRTKERLYELFQSLRLKVDSNPFSDDFNDILKVAKNKLADWMSRRKA